MAKSTKNTKVEQSSIKKSKGFQKGHTKTGGRTAGTPNKKTVKLDDILTKENFEPVREMINLYNTTEDDGIKYNVCKEFLKYVYPQRKAVDMELTGKDGEPLLAEKVYVMPEEIAEIDKHIEETLKID